ncbi:hypothetical protein PaeBR_05350 [Paenibacillus sp. BR2-3]|uniref:hypothetical protein n=1 Tax=Paenibacillus sp. BR2-3 TaxID=3048494 RepID=UPI0039775469
MPERLLPSIHQTLDSLPQLSLVIDRHGIIQFANRSWKAYSFRRGISSRLEWVGINYFEVMEELILKPEHMMVLRKSLRSIFGGEHLVYRGEFPKPPALKDSSKYFRLEAFPLIEDDNREGYSVVISHQAVPGPSEQRVRLPKKAIPVCKPPQQHFQPICASCKSIRDDKDRWATIESFLQQQLSVQFTHDICPSCIRQLYPQYARALEGSAGN